MRKALRDWLEKRRQDDRDARWRRGFMTALHHRLFVGEFKPLAPELLAEINEDPVMFNGLQQGIRYPLFGLGDDVQAERLRAIQ